MLRVITSNDTKFDKRIDGTFELLYFTAVNLSVSENIVYFKFDEEVKTELVGNSYFTSDGYLYDVYNNSTANFTYRPHFRNEIQTLQFKNVKKLNVSFFDNSQSPIAISSWTMILKQV